MNPHIKSAIAGVFVLVFVGACSVLIWLVMHDNRREDVGVASKRQRFVQERDGVPGDVTGRVYQDALVEWYPEPREVSMPGVFQERYNDTEKVIPEYKVWESGHIKTGAFTGYKVILMAYNHNDPSGISTYRFLKKDGDKTMSFLRHYSREDFFAVFDEEYLNKDIFPYKNYEYLKIPSLQYPGRMLDSEGGVLSLEEEYPVNYSNDGTVPVSETILSGVFFRSDLLKKVFDDRLYGTVYTTDSVKITESDASNIFAQHGFYVRKPDGTFVVYKGEVSILGEQSVPKVTWNDGTQARSSYSYTGTNGCGNSGFADVVDNSVRMEDLEIIGRVSDGSEVYGFRDIRNPYLRSWFDSNVEFLRVTGEDIAFSRSTDGTGGELNLAFKKDTSYESFVAQHPLFFWKDRFGRLLRFENLDFILSGGCGKPVIYLYPEKITPVSVEVLPTGGMTVSDPAYDGGWRVVAHPDGRIVNTQDGKEYPYLFWEGRGDGVYQMPTAGFVVKKDELSGFFDQKLGDFGLMTKEIEDFKEFWVPKMLSEEKPYYFITFVSRQIIDTMAPLRISPQPDTVIRVLMDYKGLDKQIVVPEFPISHTERKGFTAVEWGGVLR